MSVGSCCGGAGGILCHARLPGRGQCCPQPPGHGVDTLVVSPAPRARGGHSGGLPGTGRPLCVVLPGSQGSSPTPWAAPVTAPPQSACAPQGSARVPSRVGRARTPLSSHTRTPRVPTALDTNTPPLGPQLPWLNTF